MDDSLLFEVQESLFDDEKLSDRAKEFVLGALYGELDQVLDGAPASQPSDPSPAAGDVARAYLSSISVTSFRGIGSTATLDLPIGTGLTLVVGRNGSGKSSFADAAELALTGRCTRFSARSKDWTEAWRNLHCRDTPHVDVSLQVDGEPRGHTVRVRWDGDDVEQAEIDVHVQGGGTIEPSALGWTAASSTYRPFCTYGELTELIEGRPVDRYNLLAPMLGMDSLQPPLQSLREARLATDKTAKNGAEATKEMRRLVADSDDSRCAEVGSALDANDLDAVETIITGKQTGDDTMPSVLARLASLQHPDVQQAQGAATALRKAKHDREALTGSDADRAALIADLLRQAVTVHEHESDLVCPVCSAGMLDASRAELLREETERLDLEASAVRLADEALSRAHATAEDVIGVTPAILEQINGSAIGVDLEPVKATWATWIDTPGGAGDLADHLENAIGPLIEATDAVREHASLRSLELADIWQPIAAALAGQLDEARAGQGAQLVLPDLKKAENWFKRVEAEIRDRRFSAFANSVTETFNTIAVGSNVALDAVALAARSVDLDVTVDGEAAGALGVMSNGELHALALSLFLPRMAGEKSPFGFVVLDDPVQAMDPVRVDGLASVLGQLAEQRQVVVFTHDDRLPAAVRRLQLPATVIEVTRRPGSVVETRTRLDPVATAIEDARAVLLSEGLPDDIRRRVLPGLLRQAIEAACVDAARRRLLGTHGHAETEQLLLDNPKLIPRLALALLGDASKGGEVYATCNRRFGGWAADTVRWCNEHAHTGARPDDDLRAKVEEVQRLAEAVMGS